MSAELVLIAIPLASAVVAGWIWQNKGGSYWAAALLGLFLPVIGLVVVGMASPRPPDLSRLGRVVQVLDRHRRVIGTGALVASTKEGEPVVEVSRSVFDLAAFAEDDQGPIHNVVFKRGRWT